MPISGIGGISTWQDAVEFMLMGASGAGVHGGHVHGFRIVEDMIDGLNNYLEERHSLPSRNWSARPSIVIPNGAI